MLYISIIPPPAIKIMKPKIIIIIDTMKEESSSSTILFGLDFPKRLLIDDLL